MISQNHSLFIITEQNESRTRKKFNYHLTEQDKAQVCELVPLSQRKIHMAVRAFIIFDAQNIKKGVAAISEHMLVIFKRTLFKKLVMVTSIHQIRIISLESINKHTIIIRTKNHVITIKNPVAMRFARNLVRNYIFSTLSLPRKKQMKIIAHDHSEFPPFFPDISPSQMIQFSYNSYCTLYHTFYNHHVIKLFHKYISTGNSIIDFSLLPLSVFDLTFSKALILKPIFSSFKYSPFITGIQCQNVNRPDILKAVGEFLEHNTLVNILCLTGCNITAGGKELGNAIERNQNVNLQFIDLSDNKIDDISFFVSSLAYISSPLFYLNLNGIYINLESTKTLFNCLRRNSHLFKMTNLMINNSTINKEVCSIFTAHIQRMVQINNNVLTHLDLGCISSGAKRLFIAFANHKVPLECLKIAGSKLDDDDLSHLYIFLSNSTCLQELDVSDIKMKMKSLVKLINSIQNNENIKTFTLHLNSLKLNGSRLAKFIECFNYFKPLKFTGLGLENNDLKTEDLHDLIKLFHKMINLSWLNLSNNFSTSMKNIELEIANLLSIPRLDFLALRGSSKRAISKPTIKLFMETLLRSDRQIGIDLRYNSFSDKCVRSFIDLFNENKFTEFYIDGLKPRKSSTMANFCRAAAGSEALLSFIFPTVDIYNLMSTVKKKNYRRSIIRLDTARVQLLLKIMYNQTRNGYHSNLSFRKIPELDLLIDEATMQMNNILTTFRPNFHSVIAEILGLPLPFQKAGQHARDGGPEEEWVDTDLAADLYNAPGGLIIEDDLVNNNTLQYNSLCIRRPGATMSFQIPDSINDLLNQSHMAHSEQNVDNNTIMYDLNDQECSISREKMLSMASKSPSIASNPSSEESETHSFIRLSQPELMEEEEEEYNIYSE
ncbi:hypothetical protein TRFO_41028 [Tritrichomonas foetus]|uniref:Leucine Rich Repeat family protein n=1 Tax=Tritrichomonas foetus TaxID=1144522 RepID=A0A1J4L5V1_9EUKA|nr:hypothetical protein TRFO_41028 [Tritrichomonas foetus]|eukprot:OHT17388.1 hypothetical protein TRFO_41028 [Tritrichomonas foetus]